MSFHTIEDLPAKQGVKSIQDMQLEDNGYDFPPGVAAQMRRACDKFLESRGHIKRQWNGFLVHQKRKALQ